MTFYSANNPGITSLNARQIHSIIPNNREPTGYLSREELALALTNEDCVGIRVYKTGRRTRSVSNDELVVCGVLENGFDAPEENISFLKSKTDTIFQKIERVATITEDDTFDPKAASKIKRKDVESLLSTDTPLLAYFSLAMLNRLLNDSQVVGILLYEADLTAIQARLPHLTVPASQTLSSYLALAVENAENGRVRLPDFSTPGRNVLSDRPCPGHCLQIDPKGVVSVGDMVDLQSRLGENPYPKPWHDDLA